MRSALACSSLLVLLVAFGCSSTDTSTGGGSGSSGPPTLTITSPAAGACVEVPLDRAAGVPITIATTAITLQPPGACGLIDPCGHVVLYVGEKANNGGATPVIDVLSTPEAPLSGPFTVTLRLVSDTGVDLLDATGAPIKASIDLVAQVSCGGGSGGSGGTGGATTTTGSGGTGGSTTTTGGGGTGGSTTTTGSGGSGGATTTTGGTGGATTTTGSTGGATTTTGTGGSSSTGT